MRELLNIHKVQYKVWILAGAIASMAAAQTQVDLRTQSKSIDFSASSGTKPFQTGPTLPSTCSRGQMFFLTSAAGGQNSYGCSAPNAWVLQAGNGGTTIDASGVTVGTRQTLNLTSGSGVLLATSDTGQAILIQPSLDTSYVQTLAGQQSGSAVLCLSHSGNPVSYWCSLSPTLAAYTAGMLLNWRPDVALTGSAPTLNIDTLGAKPITEADGITTPAATGITAGQLYPIWYDGANFRLIRGSGSGGTNGTTIEASGVPVGTRPTVNLASGPGLLLATSDTGQAIFVEPSLDTSYVQTLAGQQRGSAVLCVSSGGSPVNYTCALSPTLGAYTTGMLLNWCPDVTGTGGTTKLNVDTLGAISVTGADGLSNPAASDIIAGRLYLIWYDGAVFRLVSGNGGAIAGTAFASLQGSTGAIAENGTDVTIYTVTNVPPLASGACYRLFFGETDTTAGVTLKIFVDSVLVATPAVASAAALVQGNILYCNQPGTQAAQGLIYTTPLFSGGGPSLVSSNHDQVFNTPAAVDWSTSHTIYLKANAASGGVTGQGFVIY